MKLVLAALRSSEFWTVVAQATIEAVGAPVPVEYKEIGWAYIGLRVFSKVVKYVFPHPEGGQWFKHE